MTSAGENVMAEPRRRRCTSDGKTRQRCIGRSRRTYALTLVAAWGVRVQ
jgi:hypothetical protein